MVVRYTLYKLTFPNNKIYIGQTKQKFEKRLWQHKNHSFNKKSKIYNTLICRAIRKYNWNNIKKEIILYCEENQADYYERELIKLYNSNNKNFGYNLEDGGNLNKTPSERTRKKQSKANKNRIVSEITRKKISKIHKGKLVSEETKEKISIAKSGENNPMFGKRHSKKTKQLMKENHKNVSGKNNPMYGKKRPEHSKIMNGENNPMFGKHHSAKTKEKQRQAKLGKKQTKKHIKKRINSMIRTKLRKKI